MKTIEEWFKLIKQPHIKESALRNLENRPNRQKETLVDSLGDAINLGFNWELSPEHHKYWSNLRQKAIQIDRKKGLNLEV